MVKEKNSCCSKRSQQIPILQQQLIGIVTEIQINNAIFKLELSKTDDIHQFIILPSPMYLLKSSVKGPGDGGTAKKRSFNFKDVGINSPPETKINLMKPASKSKRIGTKYYFENGINESTLNQFCYTTGNFSKIHGLKQYHYLMVDKAISTDIIKNYGSHEYLPLYVSDTATSEITSPLGEYNTDKPIEIDRSPEMITPLNEHNTMKAVETDDYQENGSIKSKVELIGSKSPQNHEYYTGESEEIRASTQITSSSQNQEGRRNTIDLKNYTRNESDIIRLINFENAKKTEFKYIDDEAVDEDSKSAYQISKGTAGTFNKEKSIFVVEENAQEGIKKQPEQPIIRNEKASITSSPEDSIYQDNKPLYHFNSESDQANRAESFSVEDLSFKTPLLSDHSLFTFDDYEVNNDFQLGGTEGNLPSDRVTKSQEFIPPNILEKLNYPHSHTKTKSQTETIVEVTKKMNFFRHAKLLNTDSDHDFTSTPDIINLNDDESSN